MKKWTIAGGICLILYMALSICVNVKKNTLYDQNAALRWSEEERFSQVSILYRLDEKIDFFTFLEQAHAIQNELDKTAYSGDDLSNGTSATSAGISKAVAVANSTASDKEISFPQSVSVTGTITLEKDNAHIEAKCIGVKEDYFTFHPMALINGNYLEADDMMDDGVIIDEEIAWKLFGSNDVSGMSVYIGGVPHVIRGVADKPEDRIAKAAGLSEPVCFVDMSTLRSYGKITGSYVYELVIPNPVDGFATKVVKDALGEKKLETVEIVENTSRYDNDKLWEVLKSFGIRSMTGQNYVYPYYENIARAWEDYLAILLLIRTIILIIPIVVTAIWVIKFVRGQYFKAFRRKWRKVCQNIKEFLELHSPV